MAIVSTSILVLTMICGIIAIGTFHFRRRRLYELASKLGGPRALPVIGNALQLIGREEDLLRKVMSLIAEYPGLCGFWLGPLLVCPITEPDLVKIVMVNNKLVEKRFVRDFSKMWLGTGLFSVLEADWYHRRKLIGSTFNMNVLRGFVTIFATQSKIFAEQLEARANGPEFNVQHRVSLCTFDMICETTMGVQMKAQTTSDCEYKTATDTLMRIATLRIIKPWLYLEPIFKLTKYSVQEIEATKVLRKHANEVIEKKRKAIRENEQKQSKDDTIGNTEIPSAEGEKKTLLDLLFENSNEDDKMTDDDLFFEINTMLIAGFDTTSNSTSFILLMLASHPEIQQKVYDELQEIFGVEDIDERPITVVDLYKMVYLERVIKESLRLVPSVPNIIRNVDQEIRVDDRVIPSPSVAILFITAIHWSEKYWPDPFKFDPDRFVPEEIDKRHPYAYIPFGVGIRNCVGLRYAMFAMKVICATILRRYVLIKDDVKPIRDMKFRLGPVLHPCEPITMRIEPRKKLVV